MNFELHEFFHSPKKRASQGLTYLFYTYALKSRVNEIHPMQEIWMSNLKFKSWIVSTKYSFVNNAFTEIYFSRKKCRALEMSDIFATFLSIAHGSLQAVWQIFQSQNLSKYRASAIIDLKPLLIINHGFYWRTSLFST